jgi:hypothetical protein
MKILMETGEREILQEAFSKIVNKDNWKFPIDAVIPEADFDKAQEAAGYFAGSPLEIVARLPDGMVRVQGPGYYVTSGA